MRRPVELLARMGIHEGEIGAQIGELLPTIARHPAEERSFAVHHLVVAQGENEILLERIHQRERDVV